MIFNFDVLAWNRTLLSSIIFIVLLYINMFILFFLNNRYTALYFMENREFFYILKYTQNILDVMYKIFVSKPAIFKGFFFAELDRQMLKPFQFLYAIYLIYMSLFLIWKNIERKWLTGSSWYVNSWLFIFTVPELEEPVAT